MKDIDFKKLSHHCPEYKKYSDGKSIGKSYSPDYALKFNNDYILFEHESEPNRKTIVADVVKAAHFFQGNKTGILIIVITPKRNSSLESYPKHVKLYYDWINDKTNLREIYFILESEYFSNGIIIEINSKIFMDKSHKLV